MWTVQGSQLMKVCWRKKINLTNGSSGSSTCTDTNENNLPTDFENAKVPASNEN